MSVGCGGGARGEGLAKARDGEAVASPGLKRVDERLALAGPGGEEAAFGQGKGAMVSEDKAAVQPPGLGGRGCAVGPEYQADAAVAAGAGRVDKRDCCLDRLAAKERLGRRDEGHRHKDEGEERESDPTTSRVSPDPASRPPAL